MGGRVLVHLRSAERACSRAWGSGRHPRVPSLLDTCASSAMHGAPRGRRGRALWSRTRRGRALNASPWLLLAVLVLSPVPAAAALGPDRTFDSFGSDPCGGGAWSQWTQLGTLPQAGYPSEALNTTGAGRVPHGGEHVMSVSGTPAKR